MGWFGIQLNAGSYFCMRDKVFWWRVIAAASGGCLGVLWAVQYTVCLLKQNRGDWILDLLHHFSPLSSLCQKGSVAGRAQINLFCWKWERYSKTHTTRKHAICARTRTTARNAFSSCVLPLEWMGGCELKWSQYSMIGECWDIGGKAAHKLIGIMHLTWHLHIIIYIYLYLCILYLDFFIINNNVLIKNCAPLSNLK